MPLGTEVGHGPGDIVLDGNPSPRPNTGAQQPPIFGPCIVAKQLHGSKCYLVGRCASARSHCVRWGPSPVPQKRQSPQFSAHVCCGQTAGWIKMPLGRDVDLVPGDIVLDGYLGPPKGAQLPLNFRPMSLMSKRLDGSRCHFVGT